MTWLSFLKSEGFDAGKFERELAALSKKITQNERAINRYAYQQKKLRNFTIAYGLLGYFAIVLYTLYAVNLNVHDLSLNQYIVVLGIPFALFALVKFVGILYRLKIKRTQTYVEQLKSQHEEKIDELKEKTKFSSTQALLQRFGDGTDLNAQIDDELLEKQKQLEEIKKLSLATSGQSFKAYPTQKKSWFDTVVDAVIGSDDLSPSNRYALICANCSIHNGLAPPGQEPQFVKYVCARCGALNGTNKPEALPEPTPEVKLDVTKDEKSEEDSGNVTLTDPKEKKQT